MSASIRISKKQLGNVVLSGFLFLTYYAWSNEIGFWGTLELSLSMEYTNTKVKVLLIFFGSIVANTSFNYLLKTVSPEKVAINIYVNSKDIWKGKRSETMLLPF